MFTNDTKQKKKNKKKSCSSKITTYITYIGFIFKQEIQKFKNKYFAFIVANFEGLLKLYLLNSNLRSKKTNK